MSGEFTVGDYLLSRLAEIGVRHVFGVPGDYNLAFLDHIVDSGEISWVGNANELNAAYAADGYARVTGAGALLTTYGVGELSAINGLAGSYAEYVPVIHIVGAPSTAAQRARALSHHTLGDGDYRHFARAQAEVTVAQAWLTEGNATAEIDRVLATSLRERRPGYLVMPTDVGIGPAERPASQLIVPPPDASASALEEFTSTARTMLAGAGSLGVLADYLADRFGVRRDVAGMVTLGEIPHATLSMGKGLFDEADPDFVGTYSGAASPKPVLAAIEEADVTICVGVRFNDTTTAGFSQQLNPERTIDVQPFGARIGSRVFAPLPMRDTVTALAGIVRGLGRSWARPELSQAPAGDVRKTAGQLGHAQLWPALQNFLRPGDIVLADQGTAFCGAQSMRLPTAVTFIGQPLWGSIGYTLPAALGAQLAAPRRRVILVIGDGAMQLTAQELGTLLREGCAPVIVLLDNDGYTIERAIHGPERVYNDIARWNWTRLPAAMGGETMRAVQVSTPAELMAALDEAAAPAGQPVLIAAKLPKMDMPEYLLALARAAATANGIGQAA